MELGDYTQPIATKSPEAQRWFDRGCVWAAGFHREEASRCFSEAIQADGSCCMAHWGLALMNGPDYNFSVKQGFYAVAAQPEGYPSLNVATTAAAKAVALAAGGPPREEALARALATRYEWPVTDGTPALQERYAEEMEKVALAFASDADVQACLRARFAHHSPSARRAPSSPLTPPSPFTDLAAAFCLAGRLRRGAALPVAVGSVREGPDTDAGRAAGAGGAGARPQGGPLAPVALPPQGSLQRDGAGRRLRLARGQRAPTLRGRGGPSDPHADPPRRPGGATPSAAPTTPDLPLISPDLGVQVGDYRSAITLNQQAVALDLKLHAISPLKPIYLSYTVHNMEFCAWAAMYAGCREAALGAATQIDEFLTDEVPRALSLCLTLTPN